MRWYEWESRNLLSTTDGQPDAADHTNVLSGLLSYRRPSGQDSKQLLKYISSSKYGMLNTADDVEGKFQQTQTED